MAPRAAIKQAILSNLKEESDCEVWEGWPSSCCSVVAPEPPRHFVACRVVFCVRKCVSWLPGAAPGAAKVWRRPRKGLPGRSTAPQKIPGYATVWSILFSCCGPFPKFVVDGGVFETYFRDLWHKLAREYTIFMNI